MNTDSDKNLESVINLIYAAIRRLIEEPREETVGGYRFENVEGTTRDEYGAMIVSLIDPNGQPMRVAIKVEHAKE